MPGVQCGEIKKLLVLETLPKPVNFSGGMEPLSYGGTFTLESDPGTWTGRKSDCSGRQFTQTVHFPARLAPVDLAVRNTQTFSGWGSLGA